MSMVSGFPQSYHHHVHPMHHHHHGGGALQPPPSDAVYVAAATAAYYPSPTRYNDGANPGVIGSGPIDGVVGGAGSPYYATASWGAAYGSTGGDSPAGEMSPVGGVGMNEFAYGVGGGGGEAQMPSDYFSGPPLDPGAAAATMTVVGNGRPPVKRRVTANRKERRRTLSINSAFSDLRDCIPNVPSDTKLSKIKTLRLATSYIAYLMDILARDDPGSIPEGGFKADINKKMDSREEKKKREMANQLGAGTAASASAPSCSELKKTKGRTGWPQHVWALELKQ